MSYLNEHLFYEYSVSVNARLARERNSYTKNVSASEREYKRNTASITSRRNRLKQSLLAYAERIETLAQQRFTAFSRFDDNPGDELLVRARPIKRKFPTKNRGKRQILSLEELINRKHSTPKDSSSNSLITLPNLDETTTSGSLRSETFKINLATVSVLKDVVGDRHSKVNSPEGSRGTQPVRNPAKPVGKLPLLTENRINSRNGKPRMDCEELNTIRKHQVCENSHHGNSAGSLHVIRQESDKHRENDNSTSEQKSYSNTVYSLGQRHVPITRTRIKRLKLPAITLDCIPEDDTKEKQGNGGDVPQLIDSVSVPDTAAKIESYQQLNTKHELKDSSCRVRTSTLESLVNSSSAPGYKATLHAKPKKRHSKLSFLRDSTRVTDRSFAHQFS